MNFKTGPDQIARQTKVPGPRGHLLLGSLRDFERDPLGLLAVAGRYGGIARLRMGPLALYLLNDPAYIQHVLLDNHRNYRKSLSYKLMKPLIGDSLLTSDGPDWVHQRRLIQPAFHQRRLASFTAVITAATAAMLADWQPRADAGQPLEMAAEMVRLSRNIIGQILFSTAIDDETQPLGRALKEAARLSDHFVTHHSRSLRGILEMAGLLPARPDRHINRAIAGLDRVIYGLLDERRQAGEGRGDMLAMLLEARDPATGEGLSRKELRDEIITLFLAGNETTGLALAWTWFLLSQHPAVEQRLAQELDRVLNGREPTVEDLPQLSYTRMVIEEAMRLYPPTWVIGRTAIAADDIGGWRIAAGSNVLLSPYLTHHSPALWAGAEKFDPERFAPERSAQRPRYAYFPFGGGPHQCIGHNLALLEAQLILATVAQRFRLTLLPGHPVVPQAMITLRPRYGVQMILEKRL